MAGYKNGRKSTSVLSPLNLLQICVSYLVLGELSSYFWQSRLYQVLFHLLPDDGILNIILGLPLAKQNFQWLDLRARFCKCKTDLTPIPHNPTLTPINSFPTGHSKTVPLLQFFFVCASVVSYVAFVLSLFVPHLSFFWNLGKAGLPDCSVFWNLHLRYIFIVTHSSS